MPRYLFHLFNDVQTTDGEGKVLSNPAAARAFAVDAARSIMANELRTTGRLNLSHWIEIEDEDGEITVVAFRDVVTLSDANSQLPSEPS